MPTNLKALTKRELFDYFKSLKEPKYRATQVFKWIWDKGEENPLNFTDISKELRNFLKENTEISSLKLQRIKNSEDGSIKFLFRLPDGLNVESVFIPMNKRRTVCVSSQVGCPLGCRFCATGTMGLMRNLEAWEIADQILQVRKFLRDRIEKDLKPVTNVVFMGMGEPFLNMDNVLKSLHYIHSPSGMHIGARHITLSTAGIVPGIYQLSEMKLQVKLAVSLHTAIQRKRIRLMPIARRYTIEEIRKACIYYIKKTNKRITFEIIQIPGVTDTDEDIEALRTFLHGMIAKINLIPYNPFPGGPYREPTNGEIGAFYRKLQRLPYAVTLRHSKGKDIKAACGQLALFFEVNSTAKHF